MTKRVQSSQRKCPCCPFITSRGISNHIVEMYESKDTSHSSWVNRLTELYDHGNGVVPKQAAKLPEYKSMNMTFMILSDILRLTGNLDTHENRYHCPCCEWVNNEFLWEHLATEDNEAHIVWRQQLKSDYDKCGSTKKMPQVYEDFGLNSGMIQNILHSIDGGIISKEVKTYECLACDYVCSSSISTHILETDDEVHEVLRQSLIFGYNEHCSSTKMFRNMEILKDTEITTSIIDEMMDKMGTRVRRQSFNHICPVPDCDWSGASRYNAHIHEKMDEGDKLHQVIYDQIIDMRSHGARSFAYIGRKVGLSQTLVESIFVKSGAPNPRSRHGETQFVDVEPESELHECFVCRMHDNNSSTSRRTMFSNLGWHLARSHSNLNIDQFESANEIASHNFSHDTASFTFGERSRRSRRNKFSNGDGGFRPDLGHSYDSRLEANYERYLIHNRINYQYHPETFDVKLADGKFSAYTPDFYLVDERIFIELKGARDQASYGNIEKIEAFQRQYPNINFKVMFQGLPEWKEIESKHCNIIPEWE